MPAIINICIAKMVPGFFDGVHPSSLACTECMLGRFCGCVRPWQVLHLGSGRCSEPLFNVTDLRLSAGVMSIGHWLFLLYCFFWAGWGLGSLPLESSPQAPHHLLLSRVRERKKTGWWVESARDGEREREGEAKQERVAIPRGTHRSETTDLVKSQLLNI